MGVMKANGEITRTERDLRRRTYGQNFIRSERLANELVALVDIRSDNLVVEPGAGRGVLTEPLAERAGEVIALELDPAWASLLREKFASHSNVSVLETDIFSFDLPRQPYRLFGNIPFGITTKLLHHFLDDVNSPLIRADMIVQWEVAVKRTTESPSNLLNLYWQPWFTFEISRRLPANEFRPIPRVDAALVTIRRRAKPLLEFHERDAFVQFVQAGFGRGGVLRAGLRDMFTRGQMRRLKSEVGFSETTRSSALSVTDWIDLFRVHKQLQPR